MNALILIFALFSSSSFAATCQPLDFDSYFIAQRAKDNIKSVNPDLTKANFGGKYLLLKNEMMSETLYLVASCETGKFFHEKLSVSVHSTVEFKPNEMTLTIHNKDQTETETWQNNEWVALDTAANTKVVSEEFLTHEYDADFKSHASTETLASCKPLNYDSYFRAQNAKASIIKENPDLTKPNFGGKYLVVKAKLLFENIALIADCSTGKFFPEMITGDVHFSKDSFFIWVTESSKFPTTYAWEHPSFIEIPNSHRSPPPSIHYTLNKEQSKDLIGFIKRDRKDTVIRDDVLDCTDDCTHRMPWIKIRGSYFKNIKCDIEKPVCEFDSETKAKT